MESEFAFGLEPQLKNSSDAELAMKEQPSELMSDK